MDPPAQHQTPSSTEQPPPPTAAPPPPSSSQPPPSSTPSTSDPPPHPSSTAPSPNPNPLQAQTLAPPQHRPPIPRNRPHLPYAPFPQSSTSAASAPAGSSLPPTSSAMPRGGVAVGVPTHHLSRPPQPPLNLSTFGSSPAFSQPFNPIVRNPGGAAEQSSASNPQGKQPVTGVHSIGMFGSLSSGTQMRPGGIPMQHPQRPIISTFRATTPSAHQSLSSQHKFHPSGISRTPSMASPSSQSPLPQSSQPLQQPLTSGPGKQMSTPTLPSSAFRPQMKSPALQQRPLHLQPHHPSLSSTSHQQQPPTLQQQQQQKHQQHLHASQSQDHLNQHYFQLRNQQSMSQQQQAARAHGSTAQKSNVSSMVQSGLGQSVAITPTGYPDAGESSNHILGKRSIRELVNQIDPFEKLDPEVEDVLVEIADDFVGSIMKFACSLAKHRNSKILETKDILLHVERNWNMTLPGFGGDEIKCFKKQVICRQQMIFTRRGLLWLRSR